MHQLKELLHPDEQKQANRIELIHPDDRKQTKRKNYERSCKLKQNEQRLESAWSVAYVNEQIIYENPKSNY